MKDEAGRDPGKEGSRTCEERDRDASGQAPGRNDEGFRVRNDTLPALRSGVGGCSPCLLLSVSYIDVETGVESGPDQLLVQGPHRFVGSCSRGGNQQPKEARHIFD